MSGISQPETFSLTWKVENFHLSNRNINAYFKTPVFRVGVLQNTSWQLLLMPEGIDELFIGCSLKRVRSENDPKIIKIKWKICLISEGGTVRFERCTDSIFSSFRTEDVPHFIKKSELLSTDTPQNNLTIYCEMTNDSLFNSKVYLTYDFEALSSDLTGLLQSEFRSDFKIYCREKIFNVHKFIILSRWPEFCKRFEIEEDISTRNDVIVIGIEPSTLYAFLTFLYSGKLKRKDLSMELCTYMHEQYCDDLMTGLETPASHLEFVTHMQYEQKHLTWEVGDDKIWNTNKVPFYRVIPLEKIYPNEMVIIFNFEKINSKEWLKLSALFTGFQPSRPILLDGEISFINKNSVVYSRKFHHILTSSGDWFFPDIVTKNDLFPNERNSKCIEINLCLFDGDVETRQVSSTIDNASHFQELSDLRKLRRDLVNSSYEKDLKLKIDDFCVEVHSPILAARSEKFRQLILQNYETIEIEENLNRKAAYSLFKHLYGGCLLNLDTTSIIALNIVAKKYSLVSLEERTRKMLEENEF